MLIIIHKDSVSFFLEGCNFKKKFEIIFPNYANMLEHEKEDDFVYI